MLIAYTQLLLLCWILFLLLVLAKSLNENKSYSASSSLTLIANFVPVKNVCAVYPFLSSIYILSFAGPNLLWKGCFDNKGMREILFLFYFFHL